MVELRHRTSPQMWAFVVSAAAGTAALAVATFGVWRWAAALLLLTIGAGVAARIWSRRSPAPMPHWMRPLLFLPRTFQSAERLKTMLQPQPGQHLLEIGPGVGVHALPIAAALMPTGVLEVLDVQRPMLDDLMRRARSVGVSNIRPRVGDARDLPYPDRSFDAVYLISVLGEVPDAHLALHELRRVLRPGGRLVVGEIVIDPDFIALRTLREWTAAAGFAFEGRSGPRFAYLASFRVAAPVLEPVIGRLDIESHLWDTAYLARGVKRDP
jgi:ubiquinone/menaquinone biosynthesis C-methylase UbiE